MKLIDLLSVISDNANVIVEDTNGTELARYDGRNSIPETLNHTTVMSQGTYVDVNWLHITVED